MYTEKKGELSFYNDMGILTLNAKQFDTGRKFSFSIIDNDEPFDMSGCTVSLRIQKADGTQFSSTECCTVEGSKVIIDTTRGNGGQILAASGINACELCLKDNNDTTLTTWNFNINVEKRVHNCENIRSSDSFDFIDNLTVSEKERIANEQAREENEINRVKNETQRIREFNDATTEINAFITNGELAMKNVNDIVDNFDKNINDIVDGITDKAQGFANSASESADIANEKAIAASVSETNADTYAKKSQSYAVGTGGEIRDGDDTDCAEYYYNQIRKISQEIGGIIPMGSISYEDLEQPENQKLGYLFNISDSFVSDERFSDGGGVFYGAGSNVLYTADNMWDVLAAPMVSGVKGASENEYRQGFVSLSAEDVGAAAKSDLDNINPLNAFYNSSSNQLDTIISDLDYIKQHPYLFGHSNTLNSLGYWINILNIKNDYYNQVSQIAVGENGMASRYYGHNTSTWSDWKISTVQQAELNNKVNKTGDTLSGRYIFQDDATIAFQGRYKTSDLISFINDSRNAGGNGIRIGKDGFVLIASGESGDLFKDVDGWSEHTYITSDGESRIIPGCQNGRDDDSRDTVFSMDGGAHIPYVTARRKEDLVNGLLPSLTVGKSQLMSDGLFISNPATRSDQGWMRMLGSNESTSCLEIATGDDGGLGEQIVARQYNASNAVAHELVLLGNSGQTEFKQFVNINTPNNTNGDIRIFRNGSQKMYLGVGVGNVNHGIYDNVLSKWMVYSDNSNTYLNGTAENATKALQDSDGKQINSTYLKKDEAESMYAKIQNNSLMFMATTSFDAYSNAASVSFLGTDPSLSSNPYYLLVAVGGSSTSTTSGTEDYGRVILTVPDQRNSSSNIVYSVSLGTFLSGTTARFSVNKTETNAERLVVNIPKGSWAKFWVWHLRM